MNITELHAENFEQEVLACKIPVVLDFWADWCEPCKMQAPVIEELAKELDGKVKFGKVDVDKEAGLALNYQVMNIPTLIVMNCGIFRARTAGFQTKEQILQLIADNQDASFSM